MFMLVRCLSCLWCFPYALVCNYIFLCFLFHAETTFVYACLWLCVLVVARHLRSELVCHNQTTLFMYSAFSHGVDWKWYWNSLLRDCTFSVSEKVLWKGIAFQDSEKVPVNMRSVGSWKVSVKVSVKNSPFQTLKRCLQRSHLYRLWKGVWKCARKGVPLKRGCFQTEKVSEKVLWKGVWKVVQAVL